MTKRPPRRRQWGFSLDEAACIHAAIAERQRSPVCPRCSSPLWVALAGDDSEELDLVTCRRCEATMMVRLPGSGALAPSR